MSAKEGLLPPGWTFPARERIGTPPEPRPKQPIISPEIERRAEIFSTILKNHGVPEDPEARGAFFDEHRDGMRRLAKIVINKEKQK